MGRGRGCLSRVTDVVTEGEEPVVDTFDTTEEGASIVGAPFTISG